VTATRTNGAAPGAKISRDDLEAKFRELQGDVQETAEEATSYAIVVAAVVVVGLAAAAFVLGRRRGRKRSTIVEIRRI
jgi:hypothetical protein